MSNCSALKNEGFRLMNEASWAPEVGLMVVAVASTQDVRDGGPAKIVSLDGRPNVVLTAFVQQMKWGSYLVVRLVQEEA